MKLKLVLEKLHKLSNPDKVDFKKDKFGVIAHNSLGIYQKDLKVLAKEIGFDNALALELFDTGIYEGRVLCSKIYRPKDLTPELMEKWVVTFENWEICDSFCMALFAKSEFAIPKIKEWCYRSSEFEKRASFATMAAYCMADKKASNALFIEFLALIKEQANDDRLYVKKAVNWALRNIGKRNIDLKELAIESALEIETYNTKAALWIAKDALRELKKEGLRSSDYPRDIYRK